MTTIQEFQEVLPLERQNMDSQLQALEFFKSYINDVYFNGALLTDFRLQCKYADISKEKIDEIVINNLKGVSKRHLKLIHEAIEIFKADEQSYFQIDADPQKIQAMDFKRIMEKQQKKFQHKKNKENSNFSSIPSKQRKQIIPHKIQALCSWMIFQHFCSISKSNDQASLLIKQMKNNIDGYFMQKTQNRQKFDFYLSQQQYISWQDCQKQQLNKKTIRQIIPSNCPIKLKQLQNFLGKTIRDAGQSMRKHYCKSDIDNFANSLQKESPIIIKSHQNIFHEEIQYMLRQKNEEQKFFSEITSKFIFDGRETGLGECLNEYFQQNGIDYERCDQDFTEDSSVKKKVKNQKKKKKKKKRKNIVTQETEEIQNPSSLKEKGKIKQINQQQKKHTQIINRLQNYSLENQERTSCFIPDQYIKKWMFKVQEQVR